MMPTRWRSWLNPKSSSKQKMGRRQNLIRAEKSNAKVQTHRPTPTRQICNGKCVGCRTITNSFLQLKSGLSLTHFDASSSVSDCAKSAIESASFQKPSEHIKNSYSNFKEKLKILFLQIFLHFYTRLLYIDLVRY